MSFTAVLYASVTAAAMLLSACAASLGVTERGPAMAPGAQDWRTEPVIYNGRRYQVAFRQRGAGHFDVRISAPGRRLGHTAGDGRIVRAVAAAAVHHFRCRSSQQARLHDVRAENGRWVMKASCN